MIWAVLNIYIARTTWHTKMKCNSARIRAWEVLVPCGRSEVILTMVTKSETVDMAVKWWLDLKSVLCAWAQFHKLSDRCSKAFSDKVPYKSSMCKFSSLGLSEKPISRHVNKLCHFSRMQKNPSSLSVCRLVYKHTLKPKVVVDCLTFQLLFGSFRVQLSARRSAIMRFLSFFQPNVGIVCTLTLEHESFLLNTFHFVTHLSPFYPKPKILCYWKEP
jgi:hypothetical protein